MRKCNTEFHRKRSSGRKVRGYGRPKDLCSFAHAAVNDKEHQLYANSLLYSMLCRAGV